MSKGNAKMADREKSANDKLHSNSGGSQTAGLPFVHFCPERYRHHARYIEVLGMMYCSKCKEAL